MMPALAIARAVKSGEVSATQVIARCLSGIEVHNPPLNAMTSVLADRAYAEAALVDRAIAAGADPGPLAGVPYAVKDLFDVAGLPTSAGSALYSDAPSARADAAVIQRLRGAGAVLVGTTNMDEFAYGFATINARHGTTCNPHDLARLAGGSSGGSAAAVAGGLVPFALGSDTNGSIRVPASLTGLYGLKPTHGSLPTDGMFPFAESFDDAGPFALSVADLGCIWEVLSGTVCGPAEAAELRIGRFGGRFLENADPEQLVACAAIAPGAPIVELPDVALARSAAFLITAYEGGDLHRAALAESALAFDPATRDRLMAGALLPASLYRDAQALRSRFTRQVAALLADFDVLIAPCTPCAAPLIADPRIMIDGQLKPARSELGIHTQPISFTGLPALAVPLLRPGALPLGLQLIGRPGGEATLLLWAKQLEQQGIIGVSPPPHAIRGA